MPPARVPRDPPRWVELGARLKVSVPSRAAASHGVVAWSETRGGYRYRLALTVELASFDGFGDPDDVNDALDGDPAALDALFGIPGVAKIGYGRLHVAAAPPRRGGP